MKTNNKYFYILWIVSFVFVFVGLSEAVATESDSDTNTYWTTLYSGLKTETPEWNSNEIAFEKTRTIITHPKHWNVYRYSGNSNLIILSPDILVSTDSGLQASVSVFECAAPARITGLTENENFLIQIEKRIISLKENGFNLGDAGLLEEHSGNIGGYWIRFNKSNIHYKGYYIESRSGSFWLELKSQKSISDELLQTFQSIVVSMQFKKLN